MINSLELVNPSKLKSDFSKMLDTRSFSMLIDFDEHLDLPTLNWLVNPKFTLAHV